MSADAPVATIRVRASTSPWPLTFSRKGRRERSAAVTSPFRNSVPNRAACLRIFSIRWGPRIPSGKPGKFSTSGVRLSWPPDSWPSTRSAVAVAPARLRRGARQVAAHVAAEEQEIGNEQHAGRPARHAAIDTGLHVGHGRLEVAGLDHAPREAVTQRAGDATHDAVRRSDPAAV